MLNVSTSRPRRSEPHAQKAHDHVVSSDGEVIAPEADAVARSGLSGDGDERLTHDQRGLQIDYAAHAKQDDAWALSADRRAKTSRAGIVQGCDVHNTTAAPAGRGRSEALCAGERGQFSSSGGHRREYAGD
jgi:hypothetical protein